MKKNNFYFDNDEYNELEKTEFVHFIYRKPKIDNSEFSQNSLRIITYNSEEFLPASSIKEFNKYISERMKYLSENMDDDQDKEIYEFSKKTMMNFINEIKSISFPRISLDNTGNVVFEWQQFNDYSMVIILFDADNRIAITGIKKNKAILRFNGILEEGIKFFLNLKNE